MSITRTSERGLSATFTRRRTDGFVLDLSLTIGEHETLAVVGPNGAGKSTLVELLAGLQPIDTGMITLNGTPIDSPADGTFVPAHRRGVGVVFQDYLLFDHLTVADNVMFGVLFGVTFGGNVGPRAAGQDRDEAVSAAERLMAKLDIAALAGRKPPSLSGGQRQRVALARAIAMSPQALLLDEPMAALDVATRSMVRRLLSEILPTVPGPKLLITHDPIDAFLLADRICVLESGRLTQSGTVHDIRRHPATDYVASLMGTNLLAGTNNRGMVEISNTTVVLHTVHTGSAGPVVVTIAPNTVALHQSQPDGSPRNTWATSVATIEDRGDITRVVLADPLTLEVDITPSAASALGLRPGTPIWAAVKATEIQVTEGRAVG